jgi:hypothetical protein
MVLRMRLLFLLMGAVVLGCVKEVPAVNQAAEAEAALQKAARVQQQLDQLERDVAHVIATVDESLWRHWTTGLALPPVSHDTLFTKDSLELLRSARLALPQQTQRIDGLTQWLTGEMVARAVAAEAETHANLEAGLTFSVEGKDVAWVDLQSLLLNEKSAVKRRALWEASMSAALRLDAALARREAKMREALTSWGLPPPLQCAAMVRGLNLTELREQAEGALAHTDAQWKETLETLAQAELKLSTASLSRADFPRLLKVPSGLDAEFPKAKIATRTVDAVATLGVYGQAGLTLDFAEAAKKNPLPLTVAPHLSDVRLSLKPVGGLRDQQVALGEVGAAIHLHAQRNLPFVQARLESPRHAVVWAELFSSLLTEETWLAAQNINQRAQVMAHARALKLFTLRQAAGTVLGALATHEMSDETEARRTFVEIQRRVWGVDVSPEEGARWRLETDDFLRSGTTLQAMVTANAWREKLGEDWWTKPMATVASSIPTSSR